MLTPCTLRIVSTSPARRATTLAGVRSSTISGFWTRSRTCTVARQPETFTVSQLSSGISSSTWLRRPSGSREKENVPIPTPFFSSARKISSSGTVSLPST